MLRIQLHGVEPHTEVSGEDLLPGTVNYLLGNDPGQWRTGIPTYAQVRYRDVYPGVDLVYYGNQGQPWPGRWAAAPGGPGPWSHAARRWRPP